MRLSKHFTLEEFVRSRKAQARGIKNEPPAEAVEGLKLLVQHILEPLRLAWGQPIFVTSGYRSPALNRAVGGVGGVPNSQHLLGQAADIVADLSLLNYDLGRLIIQLSLPFDQLIFEDCYVEYVAGRPQHCCRWIHVSYGPKNRRQVIYNKMKKIKIETILKCQEPSALNLTQKAQKKICEDLRGRRDII